MSRGDAMLPVAGNGLLDRRLFLKGGMAGIAALSFGRASAASGARPEWARAPGSPMSGYGGRSPFEAHVQRTAIVSQPGTAGSGASRTPLEHLEGTITPNGLMFERHHSGVPAIDPERHRLMIHGRVQRPLEFSMDVLERYPRVTRLHFLECSGNSGAMAVSPQAPDQSCGALHGLVSACEFTGVPLSVLLDEAGLDAGAAWVVAEGDDSARLVRSVPLAKALDDALVVMYQNGERLRPENGYPIRLFLPGFEGNMSVKWLRRLYVTDQPAMSKDETSRYSDLQPDGSARLFTFSMAVKSVITSPSPGLDLAGPGLYEISGLAWSGSGAIRQVEVSADGGASWAPAHLESPVLPRHLTRFRAPWDWNGGPAMLMSRALDDGGAVQPGRSEWLASHGGRSFYHYNAIQAWAIDEDGRSRNAYA
ncbi:MAG: sulfite dehydrogenase [Gammaproteobacteria bacterium]|nr:sulfite dehydrogenase [Gammaproteobacteria bacterium]